MPLIVLEGIDGTGKSTQAALLGDWLASLGHEVVRSCEPTNGVWGRKLRESASTGRLAPDEELEYFLRDRQEHVSELIAPALAAGKYVILDRYYFSTMAYQSLRGFDPQEIRQRNEAFAPVPDHLLILDLDVDAALDRVGSRGDVANEFEKRDALAKIREIYLSLRGESFAHLIPTACTPEEVHARIRGALAGV